MKRLLFPLLFAAVISGCGANDNNDSELIEIKERVFIYPRYSTDSSSAQKSLLLETEEEYPHSGYNLEIFSSLNGKNLDVYVKGVSLNDDDPVLDSFFPAYAHVDITSFSGEYELTIRSADYIDNYTLVVGKDSAYIAGFPTEHTKPFPFNYNKGYL